MARQSNRLDKQAEMEHTFDDEERELLRSYEAGEWVAVPDFAAEKARLEEAARNTLTLSEQLTVSLTRRDRVTLVSRATQEGLTPEALAGSILHKVLTDQLGPQTVKRRADGTARLPRTGKTTRSGAMRTKSPGNAGARRSTRKER
jgi:hypothetical protein